MRNRVSYFIYLLLIVLIFIVFQSWFGRGLIAGGDFQIYYPEMLKDLASFPFAWNWTLRDGFGTNGAAVLWNYVVVSSPIVILNSWLNLDWTVVQRLGYLYPFLIVVIISPYLFFKKYFSPPMVALAIGIFVLNTYSLMLAGGGQIFLSLAYALIPIVFMSFYGLLNMKLDSISQRAFSIAVCGLIVSLQILFDVRIAYVTLVGVGLYALISVIFFRLNPKRLIDPMFVLLISGFLHAFWILPTVFLRQNPLSALGPEFVSTGIIDFFSFAKLENTIALLQPNWPENVFGKTYFMRPEFLLLPLLAFSSLLFVNKEKKEIKQLVLFLSVSALIFSFLAKGTTDPFGSLYSWMFNNIPGFILFRDPTKWYPMIAFSYAFLVPYGIKRIYDYISHKDIPNFKGLINFQNLFVVLVVSYLIFLIKPALYQELGGVFKTTSIPAEYIKYHSFIANQPEFFRVLWVPQSSKYSFYSSLHPLVSGTAALGSPHSTDLNRLFSKPQSLRILQEASIKYVVVPLDFDKSIFLSDRKYNHDKYLKTISEIDSVSYLKEVEGFGNIKVYEVPEYNEHFFSPSENLIHSYKRNSADEYILDLKNAKKGDMIVFSETFDEKWEASNPELGYFKASSLHKPRFNSFSLTKEGDYKLRIYFKPQDHVKIGAAISLISLIMLLTFVAFNLKNRLNRQ